MNTTRTCYRHSICCKKKTRGASAVPRVCSRAWPHTLEIFAISDLHTDHPENLAWVAKNRPQQQEAITRVLLVAGDISDNLTTLTKTLSLLHEGYNKVVFIPGNHELWVSSSDRDSVEKLELVLKACEELGIETGPCSFGQFLSILPLHSWHHSSFDREPDIEGVPKASAFTIGDYAKCRWPDTIYDYFKDDPEPGQEKSGSHGSISLALWADSLNCQSIDDQRSLQAASAHGHFVISFSHFVPDQRLMPEKRYLTFPNLIKAVGSEPLGRRIKALKPNIHIFGHSHFSWDVRLIDGDTSGPGTRFISAPLCYPREREVRMKSISISSPWQESQVDKDNSFSLPLLVYRATFVSDGKISHSSDSSSNGQDETAFFRSPLPYKDLLGHSNVREWKGEECPYPLSGAMWSKYYRLNERTPENVEMAPWVKGRYMRRLKRLQ